MLFRGGLDVCTQRSNSLLGDKSAEITPTCPQICIRPSDHRRNGLVARGQGTTVPSQDNYQFMEFLQTSKPPPPSHWQDMHPPMQACTVRFSENTTPLNQRPSRKRSSPWPETRTWITQRWAGKHNLVRRTKAASCRLPSRSSYHASNYQPTCERRRSPPSVP